MTMNKAPMPPNPLLAGLLQENRIALDMRVAGKAALLADLARRASADTGLPEADVRAALTARETLGSTGFGAGIAVPHARIEGLAAPFAVLARLARPIPFDAIDGLPIDLVFLLLSPAAADGGHLAVLAAISRRLRDRIVARELRAARTAADALGVILGEV